MSLDGFIVNIQYWCGLLCPTSHLPEGIGPTENLPSGIVDTILYNNCSADILYPEKTIFYVKQKGFKAECSNTHRFFSLKQNISKNEILAILLFVYCFCVYFEEL